MLWPGPGLGEARAGPGRLEEVEREESHHFFITFFSPNILCGALWGFVVRDVVRPGHFGYIPICFQQYCNPRSFHIIFSQHTVHTYIQQTLDELKPQQTLDELKSNIVKQLPYQVQVVCLRHRVLANILKY